MQLELPFPNQDKKKKCYIAGAISGLEPFNFWINFLRAEDFMSQKYDVINPLKLHGINSLMDALNHKPKKWIEYMRVDIANLVFCDAIALIPGYEKSKGAMLELKVAQGLGLEIVEFHKYAEFNQPKQ